MAMWGTFSHIGGGVRIKELEIRARREGAAEFPRALESRRPLRRLQLRHRGGTGRVRAWPKMAQLASVRAQATEQGGSCEQRGTVWKPGGKGSIVTRGPGYLEG